MVNNQIEFNNKYPKELKEIKIKYKDFRGQLVIENYPQLEKLILRSVESMERIIFKNLTQLQECVIWDCGTKELTIENCSQIKKLNARSNLLTNLNFLKSLENLEELELDNNTSIDSGLEYLPNSLERFSYENTKLTIILKPYRGDWKTYSKDVKELKEFAGQKPHELLKSIQDLKAEVKKIKQNQPKVLGNYVDFERKYRELKKTLSFLIKEEELKTQEINQIVTRELAEELSGEWKESKVKISELQKLNKQLIEKLSVYEAVRNKINQKEKELEELKNTIVARYQLEEDDLEDLLEAQTDFFQNNNYKRLERTKRRLIKVISEEETTNLCQKQEVIIKLQNNIYQREQQICQIISGNDFDHLRGVLYDSFLEKNDISDQPKVQKHGSFNETNLCSQLEKEKKELKRMIDLVKGKLNEESKLLLEILLKTQSDIIRLGNDPFVKERLEDLMSKFKGKIDERGLEKLCQKQKEVICLEEIISTDKKEEAQSIAQIQMISK